MDPAESIQKSSGKRKFPQRSNRYSADFKLQVVKKYIEESIQPQAAWRIAAQAWLKMKGFITVTVNGKVLPYFS